MEYKYIVIYGTEHKAAQNSPFIGRNNFLGLAKLYVCVCVCVRAAPTVRTRLLFSIPVCNILLSKFFFSKCFPRY